MPYSDNCRRARVGAKSKTKQTGLRISSSFGLSPFGFLMDHGDCTRNAAWKYVSGDFKFRSIRILDHCETVTPVVNVPHESVIVFVSQPLPIALRTGGSASRPIHAPAPAATPTLYARQNTLSFSANRFAIAWQAATLGRNQNECCRYGKSRASEYG